MVGTPLWFYVREASKLIEATSQERAGLPVVRALSDTSKALQKNRGVATTWLNETGNAAQRQAAETEVDKMLDAALKATSEKSTPEVIRKLVEQVSGDWKTLKADIAAKRINIDASRKRHNAMLERLLRSVTVVADDYGLTLDPEANTYHLVMGSIHYSPGLIDALSSLRARGADILSSGQNKNPEDFTIAGVSAERAAYFGKASLDSFAKAIEADASLEKSLKALREDADKKLKDVMTLSRSLLVGMDVLVSATDYRKRMNEAITAQEKVGALAFDQLGLLLKAREDTMQRSFYLLLGLVLGIAGLASALGVLIARSVVKPLAAAVQVADAVAQGNLDNTVDAGHVDEVGRLNQAMKHMQERLKAFAAAQVEMAAKHDAGEISFRMNANALPGAYGELAGKVNELVGAHIAVKMKVVEVVKRYATGDLTVDMEPLPGEKAKITEAMDGVKASLFAVNGQIQTLVEAAAQGNFSVRGDETKFDHEFRKMIAGLNRLMQTADTGLNEVSRVLGALAKGDLTEKITADYQGTFGQLKNDSNQTVDNLTAIVHQIKDATETIETASREITQGNSDLSNRTEQQASSLEETASSMEEITSTVKQNAENARQANQLAAGASSVAVKGGQVVGQVVSTMSGISESSKKIADIIGVIDGIAFQTNILALNAAVEAARAGEQGRGFAVVASEVRNLAQRSANAAKEIKQLIQDSVTRVDAGTKLVDEAGQTMDEIVSSVKRVTDIMAEITNASQEQSSGIEEVNQAITQMDEVTQQNAALVEEAAAAAESMQEQAGNLVQTVAQFRLSRAAATLEAAFDFDAAIKAHDDWKRRLHEHLDGKGEALDAAKVSRDDCCPLGGWIHGAGTRYAGHGEYGALKSAHAGFHQCAGEVVRLTQAQNRDGASTLLDTQFVERSKDTIGKLHAMKRAVASSAAPAALHGERRGPDRAINVARLPARNAKPAKPVKAIAAAPRAKVAGADEDWQEF